MIFVPYALFLGTGLGIFLAGVGVGFFKASRESADLWVDGMHAGYQQALHDVRKLTQQEEREERYGKYERN